MALSLSVSHAVPPSHRISSHFTNATMQSARLTEPHKRKCELGLTRQTVHEVSRMPDFALPSPPAPGTGLMLAPQTSGENEDIWLAMTLAMVNINADQISDMLSSVDHHATLNRAQIQLKMAAIERQSKASAKEKQGSVASFWLGLITDAALLAGSVALTFMTGGATSFLIGLAVANVALSMWEITAKIVSHFEGPDLSLAKGLSSFAKACGASDDTAGKVGTYGSISVKITLAITNFVALWKASAHVAKAAGEAATAAAQANGATASEVALAATQATASATGQCAMTVAQRCMTALTVTSTLTSAANAGASMITAVLTDERQAAEYDIAHTKNTSRLLKGYIDRAIKAMEEAFSFRNEWMSGSRQQMNLAFQSRNCVFSG